MRKCMKLDVKAEPEYDAGGRMIRRRGLEYVVIGRCCFKRGEVCGCEKLMDVTTGS